MSGGGSCDIDVDLSLSDRLKVFKTTNFDPHAYVTSKCQSMNEKEIRHLCSYLLDLKKASAEEMRKSVFANYSAFIRTSKEISNLEGQILSLKNLFSTRAALVHALADGIHIDSLPTIRNSEWDDRTSTREPSRTEKWLSDFVDKVDVLLAEKRVDEALAAFEEGESVAEDAKYCKTLSTALLSSLRNYLTIQRQKLADHLEATACQPSARGVELRSAVMAMKHLGDDHRAHTLLLNSHFQRLQYNTQNIRPVGYPNGAGYIASVSQVVFSAIYRAADDSLSLFGEDPAFSSELVSWAVTQTNSYAFFVKRNALDSFAATGGLRSASDCVQICLEHCSTLEARGLVLSPVFLKIFRPLVEQALKANNKRIVKNAIAIAAIEDWALTTTLGSHVDNMASVGISNSCQPKLSRSAHKFIGMVQEMLEEVRPLETLQLVGLTLECLLQTFSSYVNVLISALPGSMESEGNPDGSGPKIVKTAQSEPQQIALLANALILADELIPQAVAKLFTSQQSGKPNESSRKLSEIQFRVSEQREWKKKLTRMVDRLRDSFCRQHALELMFTEDGDIRLTASMYTSMDRIPDEPEWFPSLIFQELYEKLTRMSTAAMDIFVGRERFVTVLLMRLTEAAVLWLSEDQGFWEEVEDGPNGLGPLGLQQLYLDMEFIVLFSSQGRHLSRNLHNVTKNIISRALDAVSATGVNPNSIIPEDEWFADVAEIAIKMLSGKANFDNVDIFSPTASASTKSVSPVLSHGCN